MTRDYNLKKLETKRLFQEEVQNILDLDDIGELLATGSQTIVITPTPKFKALTNIKDPVVIFTKDRLKLTVLKKIIPETAEIEDVYFSMSEELENAGFYLFFCTKFEEFNIPYDSVISEAMSIYIEMLDEKEENETKKTLDPQKELLDFSNAIDKAILVWEGDEEVARSKKVFEDAKDIALAFYEALEAVNRSEIGDSEEFAIDLHEMQFVKHNGELICIDPVIFEN